MNATKLSSTSTPKSNEKSILKVRTRNTEVTNISSTDHSDSFVVSKKTDDDKVQDIGATTTTTKRKKKKKKKKSNHNNNKTKKARSVSAKRAATRRQLESSPCEESPRRPKSNNDIDSFKKMGDDNDMMSKLSDQGQVMKKKKEKGTKTASTATAVIIIIKKKYPSSEETETNANNGSPVMEKIPECPPSTKDSSELSSKGDARENESGKTIIIKNGKGAATTTITIPTVFNGMNQSSHHDHDDTKEEAPSSQDLSTTSVPRMTEEELKQLLRNAREYLNADIRLISACQDEQQTSDCSNVKVRFGLRDSIRGSEAFGLDGGACTSVLLKTLYEYYENPKLRGKAPKWIDLLHQLRSELKDKGYQQVPALTASRPVSMKDEFNIIPKNNHNGRKRALVIGIRYKGTPYELPGCHNDCHAMIRYLKTCHGFEDDDITILMDDGGLHTVPTRENIVKAFHRFAFSLKAGDAAFFHFAGHGSSVKDKSGDESSGLDSTLLPVDVKESGPIVDDEIFRILLIPLPRGLQLTAIVDCCHSGTIFDLPFEFIGDAKYENGNEMEFRKVTFPHMKMVRAERRRIKMMKEIKMTASAMEEKLVASPVKMKKLAVPLDTIEEPPLSRTSGINASDDTVDARGKAKDNPFLIALGCILLCMNPFKLFKAIS